MVADSRSGKCVSGSSQQVKANLEGELGRIEGLQARLAADKVILGQLMLSILIAAFAVIFQALYVITGLKVEVDSYSCDKYGSNCDQVEEDN
jgi:hypothetical protein